jgi:transposase
LSNRGKTFWHKTAKLSGKGHAGLTLPQNNGLVEGKVNKLKLIKRMMYGRAKFPLLRQRVLHAL